MTLTTHVLDTARGQPAAGIAIELYALDGPTPALVARSTTNSDGRTDAPLGDDLPPGTYELIFSTAPYFAQLGVAAFYSDIPLRFRLAGDGARYHVPLLLSPWGYATYRGS
jgi:5-hydroxyisourate hydrolase